jgi:ankyrin repeat protein
MDRLCQAARSGHLSVLQNAVGRGLSIDAPNEDKWTPLHFAVLARQVEVVRYLITGKAKANVNARTSTRLSPLHFAAQVGDEFIVALLIESGADVRSRDANEQTPLHFAVSSQNLIAVRLLLDFSADPNASDSRGFAPMHIAADIGNAELVDLLLSRGAKPDLVVQQSKALGWSPIHLAAHHGYVDIIEKLLSARANTPIPSVVTPLHVAAAQSRVEVIDLLIREGSPVDAVDANGEPPLFVAVRQRLLENVKRLATDRTVQIQNLKTQRIALHVASELGHFEIVEFLLGIAKEQVSKADRQGNTPLHLAVAARRKEVVGPLLEAGADLMVRNKARQSPYSLGVGSIRTLINKHIASHPECLQPAPVYGTARKSAARSESSKLDTWPEVTGLPRQRRQPDDLESLKTQISREITDVRQQVDAKVHDINELMKELREDAARL